MLSYNLLESISRKYGDSFYLVDSKVIEDNYRGLLNAFQKVYSKTKIAYSYKTNYAPQICGLVNDLGGAAEVVSEMELWLAQKIGVIPSETYYNGPYKKYHYIEKALLSGVHVNIDAKYELDMVQNIADRYPEKNFEIGVRCNIDIGQDIPSRFGFDVASGELKDVIERVGEMSNVNLVGLHCHIPFRALETYMLRVKKMNAILDMFPQIDLSYISMGGGYMGNMGKHMAEQFNFMAPSFDDYAAIVAGFMRDRYQGRENQPLLIIEPGSALVADSMKYVTRVLNIKCARNIKIASLTGSSFQVNPSVKDINRPIEVFHGSDNDYKSEYYDDLYMAGYTCIESDYLYKGYKGKLEVGDYVVFGNVGSYSVVMKPPFILPDIPIVEIKDDLSDEMWKKQQTPENIFQLFVNIFK